MGWTLGLMMALLPVLVQAQGWQEPPRGSATRADLLDAIRPQVEWQLGSPVEFVVHDLRVAGGVAFANLYPQRPGGGQIDPYQAPAYRRGELAPEQMDGIGVQALYWRSGRTWVALHWVMGAGDVWYATPEFCAYWRAVIAEACQGI
ncbi:MAG: hypothetical protein KDK24_05665 [Pseudooceanicola sp.]|nr:hypothetical protein [Pseudooceanicola sp.]